MSTQAVETVVVGAGISGLATAAALGKGAEVVVLEADSEVGGYCKTVEKAGFTWDYSGHFFHFKQPGIERWLRERMPGQVIRTVDKKSFISFGGTWVDFPFQKNIHQLPQADFIECLHDLYFARTDPKPGQPANFKDMLERRYGRGITEKFLVPYNEKLYATDLATLDVEAMGRFFPHADLTDIVRNMKKADNRSYNSTFTYPQGGAIQYVRALESALAPGTVRLNEGATRIDVANKTVHTPKGSYRYQRLVSSAPFPKLLELAGVAFDSKTYGWNQVLVFNLGFDRKGPKDVHWLYVPNKERSFYRVGFYDNIFDTPRMSLYVELGYPRDAKPDVAQARERVLADLEAEGLVTDHQLVAEHSVLMNPAYVHITQASLIAHRAESQALQREGIFSIGRYGGWTYCSIEDNIIEARTLVQGWLGRPTGLGDE